MSVKTTSASSNALKNTLERLFQILLWIFQSPVVNSLAFFPSVCFVFELRVGSLSPSVAPSRTAAHETWGQVANLTNRSRDITPLLIPLIACIDSLHSRNLNKRVDKKSTTKRFERAMKGWITTSTMRPTIDCSLTDGGGTSRQISSMTLTDQLRVGFWRWEDLHAVLGKLRAICAVDLCSEAF